jgi:hypothetical protein
LLAVIGSDICVAAEDGQFAWVPIRRLSVADREFAAPNRQQAAQTYGAVRVWTDSTGRHQIRARMLEMVEGKVRLMTEDGRLGLARIERLSAPDRAFVAEFREVASLASLDADTTNSPNLRISPDVVYGKTKTWTDNTGRHQVQARLCQIEENQICLLREDGRIVQVPTQRLSASDRQFVVQAIHTLGRDAIALARN